MVTYGAGKAPIEHFFKTLQPSAKSAAEIAKSMGDQSEYALYKKDLIQLGLFPQEAEQMTTKEFFINQPLRTGAGNAAVGTAASSAANAVSAFRAKWMDDSFGDQSVAAKPHMGIDMDVELGYDG